MGPVQGSGEPKAGDKAEASTYDQVKQRLEDVKRAKDALSKNPEMVSLLSQLTFEEVRLESELEDLKPKVPPSVYARRLPEKSPRKAKRRRS